MCKCLCHQAGSFSLALSKKILVNFENGETIINVFSTFSTDIGVDFLTPKGINKNNVTGACRVNTLEKFIGYSKAINFRRQTFSHNFPDPSYAERIGSCLARVYRVTDALGKFGEHSRIKEARVSCSRLRFEPPLRFSCVN